MATTRNEFVVDTPLQLSRISSDQKKRLDKVSGDTMLNLDNVDQGGVHVVEHGYDGEYEFTPTQSTQIAYTADKTLAQNITINPIPSNYGLITWNGSVLTVS